MINITANLKPLLKLKVIKKLLTIAASLIALSFSGQVHSNQATAINQQIRTQVDAYFDQIAKQSHYSRMTHQFKLPDERLNLASCPAPLKIANRNPRRKLGRLTLRVSCDAADRPWSINMGVKLMAFDQVVMSRRAIPRGSKISADMVEQVEQEVTRLYAGYFTRLKPVIGSQARFAIPGNRVLTPGNILPPKLVIKGETVIIKANLSGLAIHTKGEALSDGVLGELIKVKNARSSRIIEGRITGAGQVHVSM